MKFEKHPDCLPKNFNINRMIAFCTFCCVFIAQKLCLASENDDDGKLCGAECIYVVMRGLSPETCPSRFVELTEFLGQPEKKGYSLYELKSAVNHYGIFAECMKIDYEMLVDLLKENAVVLHLLPGHFVLCKSATKEGIVVFDPSSKTSVLTMEQIKNEWQGNCLVLGTQAIVIGRKSTMFSLVVRLISSISVIAMIIWGVSLVYKYLSSHTRVRL